MYLFLFQAPKHKSSSSWQYYRHKKSNYRGEFDLRHLRRATKGNATIWGCGTHPAQKILRDVGLADLMNGHLIEVEDGKVAMWIKLNYDLLGKGGVTYVGGFKDLDVEEMTKFRDKIIKLNTERRTAGQVSSDINNLHYSLTRLLSRPSIREGTDTELSQDDITSCRDMADRLNGIIATKRLLDTSILNAVNTLKSDLSDYVKSCGMDPGTRK